MLVSRALIVREPWIDHILDGRKIWEMRTGTTTQRGWFGLIRKGSGAVWGVARLVGCREPLTRDQLLATIEKHCIPAEMINAGQVDSWTTPWELADVICLREPVPYEAKSGAVTWVILDETVSQAIDREITGNRLDASSSLLPSTRLGSIQAETIVRRTGADSMRGAIHPTVHSTLARILPEYSEQTERLLGISEITAGNIANNHIYLRQFIDKFPDDVMGGSNKNERGRQVIVEWLGGSPTNTDIDGEKKIFRSRSWIGQFFKLRNVKSGDRVAVYERAPYRYRIEHLKG